MKFADLYPIVLTVALTFIVMFLLDFMGEGNPIKKVAQELSNFENARLE